MNVRRASSRRAFLAGAIILVCTSLAVAVWTLNAPSRTIVCVDFTADPGKLSYCRER